MMLKNMKKNLVDIIGHLLVKYFSQNKRIKFSKNNKKWKMFKKSNRIQFNMLSLKKLKLKRRRKSIEKLRQQKEIFFKTLQKGKDLVIF